MRDLLAQLQHAAATRDQDDVIIDIPAAETSADRDDTTFRRIAAIRDKTAELHRLASEVDSANRRQLQEYASDGTSRAREQARSLEQQFHLHAREVKDMMQDLKTRLNTLITLSADDKNNIHDQEIRIIKSHYGALLAHFATVLGAYRDTQDQHRAKQRDAFARSCRIVQPKISDDAIGRLAQQAEILPADLAQVEAVCEDVKMNHGMIIDLERALTDLHDLFLDMAIIIESQSDLINNVEQSVTSALEYSVRSSRHVAAAREYQGKYRRKQWCICMWIFLIAAIVVLVVVLTI